MPRTAVRLHTSRQLGQTIEDYYVIDGEAGTYRFRERAIYGPSGPVTHIDTEPEIDADTQAWLSAEIAKEVAKVAADKARSKYWDIRYDDKGNPRWVNSRFGTPTKQESLHVHVLESKNRARSIYEDLNEMIGLMAIERNKLAKLQQMTTE